MTVPMEYKYASRDFDAFLTDARRMLDLATPHQTYTAVQAVLTVFRRRLNVGQTIAFAQVLPPVLRAIFVYEWKPEEPAVAFEERARLTREVQAYRGDHNFAPDSAIADVAAALRRHVHVKAFDVVLAQLPPGSVEFWSVTKA
jgi:uncharacterized protein (DUF2267 family)